jgi:hypothetical protein
MSLKFPIYLARFLAIANKTDIAVHVKYEIMSLIETSC